MSDVLSNGFVVFANVFNSSILAENGIEQPTVEQTKDFVNTVLKGVALPVSPAFSVEDYGIEDKNGQLKPKFNGKNPSYLQANGTPQIIKHSQYKDKLPLDSTYSNIYRIKEQQGIGILVNDSCLSLPLDFDRKNFESDDHLNQVITDLIKKHPKLKNAYIEKTRNGGFHIFIKVRNKPDFTLFSLEGHHNHCGELLKNNFCVMAPTGGYVVVNKPENLADIPEFNDVSEIGIVKFSDVQAQLVEKPVTVTEANEVFSNLATTQVRFEKLITNDCLGILHGSYSETDDRSGLLTKFTKEIYGWNNWLQKNCSELLAEKPEDIITTCGNALGFDSDRIDRVLKTIDSHNCLPSCHAFGGDNACWKKINRLTSTRKPYEVSSTIEETVLIDFFGDGEGDYAVLKGAFIKYSKQGYWDVLEEEAVERYITEELRKCFSYKKTKDGHIIEHKYATEKNKVAVLKFCRSNLSIQTNQNNTLRCFQDVTVDLTNGDILSHAKEHFLTSRINHKYIKDAECPQVFLDFVETSFGLELLPVIRAITSMMLDPTAPYGYFPHIIGDSGSGKGTLIRLWAKMFDSKSVTNQNTLDLFNNPDKCHQFLAGKALCLFPDLLGFQSKLGGFYEAVDNGEVACRPLFSSNSYLKRLDMRIAIASTTQLSLENAADGLNRRIIPIPTKPVSRNRIVNPNLNRELETELANIISWALSIDKKQRNDLIINASKIEAIARMKLEQNIASNPVMAFADCSLEYKEGFISVNDLYSCYNIFCLKFGYKTLSKNVFCSRLKKIIPDNYLDSKTERVNGKVERISARLKNIALTNAYHAVGNGEFGCNPELCIPGCLNLLNQPLDEPTVTFQSNSPVAPIDNLMNLKCDLSQVHSDIHRVGEILCKAGNELREEFYAGTDANRKDFYEKARKAFENNQNQSKANVTVLGLNLPMDADIDDF